MHVIRGEGQFRGLVGRIYPVLAVPVLAVTVGINVVQFMSVRPSLPTLFVSFLPSAMVASLLLAGLLALRFQGTLFPTLALPLGRPRLILASASIVIALASLGAFAAVVSVGNWGMFLAVPILLAFVALVAMVGLSMFRVVDAIALYFAVWPALAFIRTNMIRGQFTILAKEQDIQQSVLIVPMQVPVELLAGHPSATVAVNVWGQLALLSPEALFISAIFLGWFFSARRDVARGPARTPIYVAVMVLLGAAFVSAMLSTLPVFSLVWLLGELVIPILLFYMVATSVRSEGDLMRVLWGMMVGLAFIAGYTLFAKYQAFAGAQVGFEFNTIRGFGGWNPVLGNPNVAGSVMTYLLVAPLAILAHGQGGGLGRAAVLGVLVLTFFSIIVSSSRGPWLAVLVMFLLVFFLVPRTRTFLLLGMAGLALFLMPVLGEVKQLIIQVKPSLTTPLSQEIGVTARIDVWRESVEVLASPQILGVGPGLYPSLEISAPQAPSRIFLHPHQIFLNLGVETGLVGLAAFVAIVLLIARHSRRLLKSLQESPYRDVLQILAIGLVGFLVVATTTGTPFNNGTGGLATGLIPWAIAGLLMGAWRSGASQAQVQEEARLRLVRPISEVAHDSKGS